MDIIEEWRTKSDADQNRAAKIVEILRQNGIRMSVEAAGYEDARVRFEYNGVEIAPEFTYMRFDMFENEGR